MIDHKGEQHHSDLHEIEEKIRNHPEVENVLVVSVPNPSDDEVLIAWVIKTNSSNITSKDLRNYCINQKFTQDKIPKYFEFISEYPMTPSGKVQKLKLMEKAKSLINNKNN
ncbi:AMP-binding enzyme [Filobacillus milosensis]|uniref:AMP-binding enzyme n=1 Tax=Filobacillus milosensis TaxID=94137 RepID=UPI001890D037|nr:hypothetical protein [Filobacillus milosensis]